jgi:hypothetical protein
MMMTTMTTTMMMRALSQIHLLAPIHLNQKFLIHHITQRMTTTMMMMTTTMTMMIVVKFLSHQTMMTMMTMTMMMTTMTNLQFHRMKSYPSETWKPSSNFYNKYKTMNFLSELLIRRILTKLW